MKTFKFALGKTIQAESDVIQEDRYHSLYYFKVEIIIEIVCYLFLRSIIRHNIKEISIFYNFTINLWLTTLDF